MLYLLDLIWLSPAIIDCTHEALFSINFSQYMDYLDQLQAEYPDLMDIETLGNETYEKNKMKVVKVIFLSFFTHFFLFFSSILLQTCVLILNLILFNYKYHFFIKSSSHIKLIA